jgi:acyl carrier protein
MATERAFGVDISDADAAQCRTVGDLHRCLMRLLAERYQRDGLALIVDPEISWNLLVPLIVEHTGVRPEQIRPDAEWGRDLGID